MQIAQFIAMTRDESAVAGGASLPQGAIRLDTSLGGFDSESLKQIESTIGENRAHIVWATPDGALRVQSDWTRDPASGVWQREDALLNTGKHSITIQRALARFVFVPGQYDVYSQTSAWCKENQGSWRAVQQGGLLIRSEGGQTCRGASPMVAIRDAKQGSGMVFHILPRGNWTARLTTHTARLRGDPFVVLELGLDDDHLRVQLAPQQSLELPTILFSELEQGDLTLAAPALQRYVLQSSLPPAKQPSPIIYNTWFDVHEWFTIERLRRQLAVARRIGCEVFVIDAGWYGAGSGGWSDQVGDWREKLDGGLRGRMADFAAEVRNQGLGFGLWMEPERLAAAVPIVREKPQWFKTSDGKNFWPDLENPQAYAWLLAEVARLVETYKLVWMKLDFNFERGVDPSGSEFAGYYHALYRLLDELRMRFPQVFWEGCASGGLRLDLNTLAHCDGHFLSDTVTPLDVLRISQGAFLRLPPGRITRWAVLGASQRDAAGMPLADKRARAILTPLGAHWRHSTPTTVDFACRVAMPGLFGLSGDLASLPPQAQDRLAVHVAFYKTWRAFIANSVARLLTPPCPLGDSRGWAAFQLQHVKEPSSLVFAYRLDDPAGKMRLRLHGMDPLARYTVSIDSRVQATLTGKQLMEDGLTAEIPTRNGAQILVIQPAPADK